MLYKIDARESTFPKIQSINFLSLISLIFFYPENCHGFYIYANKPSRSIQFKFSKKCSFYFWKNKKTLFFIILIRLDISFDKIKRFFSARASIATRKLRWEFSRPKKVAQKASSSILSKIVYQKVRAKKREFIWAYFQEWVNSSGACSAAARWDTPSSPELLKPAF